MKKLLRLLHGIEDGLLVALLGAMILLATLQILLRNGFGAGIDSADSILRVLVLWLGMVGAGVASRTNRHIRIDVLSGLLGARTGLLLEALVSLVSAAVCSTVAVTGMDWVRFEYQDGMAGIAGLPAWMLEVIVPFTFGLIGLRYALSAIRIGRYFLRRWLLHLALRRPQQELGS